MGSLARRLINRERTPYLQLTVLMEDSAGSGHLLSEHGFCIHVRTPHTCGIYDTGATGKFLQNARQLDIDCAECDWVALSHGHYDHSGGLKDLLQENPGKIEVHSGEGAWRQKYASHENGEMYSNGLPFAIETLRPLSKSITEHPVTTEIATGIFLLAAPPMECEYEKIPRRFQLKDNSGGGYFQDNFEDERPLAIDTPEGIVLLTGCAHRGAINTLHQAVKYFPHKKIIAVVGGFHLGSATAEAVEQKADEFISHNVQLVGMAHCTGCTAAEILQRKLPGRAAYCHSGTSLTFNSRGITIDAPLKESGY